jgi:hypothetical protein
MTTRRGWPKRRSPDRLLRGRVARLKKLANLHGTRFDDLFRKSDAWAVESAGDRAALREGVARDAGGRRGGPIAIAAAGVIPAFVVCASGAPTVGRAGWRTARLSFPHQSKLAQARHPVLRMPRPDDLSVLEFMNVDGLDLHGSACRWKAQERTAQGG